MAGIKERWTVQYSDGTMRTVVAQGPHSAKQVFQIRYAPPPGQCCVAWPQSEPDRKVRFITGGQGTKPLSRSAPARRRRTPSRSADDDTRDEQERMARAIRNMSPSQFRALQSNGEDYDYDDEEDEDYEYDE